MKAILADKDGNKKETLIKARDDSEGFIEVRISYTTESNDTEGEGDTIEQN